MAITILNIIEHHVFYLKHVSENRFCLRIQVKLTQFGPIDTSSLCFRSGGRCIITRIVMFIVNFMFVAITKPLTFSGYS
jgi:hypothetical protein